MGFLVLIEVNMDWMLEDEESPQETCQTQGTPIFELLAISNLATAWPELEALWNNHVVKISSRLTPMQACFHRWPSHAWLVLNVLSLPASIGLYNRRPIFSGS